MSAKPRPLALFLALVAETSILVLPVLLVPIFLVAAILTAILLGGTLRGLFQWSRGLIILLVVLFLVRTIGRGVDAAILPWSIYAGRLLTGLIIAYTLYTAIGAHGLLLTLIAVFSFLPRSALRRFLEDTTRALILLLPILLRSLRQVKDALRVRRPSGRRYIRRILAVYLTTVARIPKERAEALVVRQLR